MRTLTGRVDSLPQSPKLHAAGESQPPRDARRPMKVLVFTSLYPNNVVNHHGVFIKERMTHFARLDGCQVKVVAPVPYFPPIKGNWRWQYSQVASRETRDGLEVYHPRYIMPPKIGMTLYGWLMFLSVLPTVRRIRRHFDFDLIDAHYVYPDGLAAILLGRLWGKPVVISARGSDVNQYADLPLIPTLLRYALLRAPRSIAVCRALKDAMVDLGVPGDRIAVIPNGVDLKKFRPYPMAAARQELGLPSDQTILLSVGSLIPRKGIDLLIKALAILRDEHGRGNVTLAVVGNGPLESELKRLAGSLGLGGAVRFCGSVAHEKLHVWYSAADLFCLTSAREGWPNVLLESMACGTPVVATGVWGVPEVVRSDEVGLLTELDERAIARTVAAALGRPWDRERVRQYAEEHSWDHVARSVQDVFETVLNGQST